MKDKLRRALALTAAVLLLSALSGCAQFIRQTAEVTLPPEPTSTPAPEPTPEPAGEPSPEPTPEPTSEPTPEPTSEPTRADLDFDAQQLSVKVYPSDRDEAANGYWELVDGRVASRVVLNEGDELVVCCDGTATGLYVIWNKPAGLWQLSGEGWTIERGEFGCIHDFVELPEGAEEIRLRVTQECLLADVYAYTDGRLPADVQVWQPPVEQADLLLFPTHADDEWLFFGGAIPVYAAERGLQVEVCYVNNHWVEQPREHELLNGLWKGGMTNYPIISDIPDHASENVWQAEAMYGDSFKEFQVQMIRRFRPLVVVGHALNGEYANGAHMLNARSLVEAVELAADESYDPASAELYGVWDTPKLYLHLYEENPIVMDWDQPLDSFDGLSGYEVAALAYGEHESQHVWDFRVYPLEHVFSCYKFGLVRSTVGPDVEKNDFMENIEPRS